MSADIPLSGPRPNLIFPAGKIRAMAQGPARCQAVFPAGKAILKCHGPCFHQESPQTCVTPFLAGKIPLPYPI